MMDTGHHTFVQTHKKYTTKNEPWCKLWTSGDDFSVGSTVLRNVPLVEMLVMGEAVHLWGLGVLGTLCTFPLSFAVNFKLLLKSLNLKKEFEKT